MSVLQRTAPKMTRSQKSFLLKVARALGTCQLVEFELKNYITEAFELCKKRLAGFPPFAMTGADCKKESLGGLIKIFQKLSDCPQLVDRLKSLTFDRNFLAHKAIATCIYPDGSFDLNAAKKILVRLQKVEQEALAVIDAIHEESRKWLAHLYFDPID